MQSPSPRLLGQSFASNHSRSASATPTVNSPRRAVARSGSTSALASLSTAPGQQVLPRSRLQIDSEFFSTQPDPRSPDDFPSPHHSSPTTSLHPDLNSEVTNLSNKLISAINHQTNLDDALSAARQQLEASEERIRVLEAETRNHANLLATGALVKKADVEEQASRLGAKLVEEKDKRSVVEKDKKGIEQELESLTSALFEEANEMVAVARKEREAAERRTEQVRSQLKDMEILLASHQEQLAELKTVMQQMSSEREDPELATNKSSAPSTPALPAHSEMSRVFEGLRISPAVPGVDDVPPAPPTSFSHLLSPVLRTDLPSYDDFRALLQISRKSAPASRVNSGSYGGVNIPGLASRDASSQSNHLPSNGSAVSLHMPGVYHQTSSHSASSSTTGIGAMPPIVIPLKETRFYKRALTEDIEPTLRLDTAPGLSWLARRAVVNSMCDGSLVVEPMPASSKMQIFSCALCGESRKGEEFIRSHRFRTSESENAQRYPLCGYCLSRVRAVCDYLGFLRMVKDGHWRTDGAEAEKIAWEESVRLRERMFWARIGGGVVPAFIHRESPRGSTEDAKPRTPYSAPIIMNGIGMSNRRPNENDDPFRSSTKRASEGATMALRTKHSPNGDNPDQSVHTSAPTTDESPPLDALKKDAALPPSQRKASETLNHASLRESLKPRPRSRAASYERERTATPHVTPQLGSTSPVPTDQPVKSDQGLQISLPGSFE